MNKKLKSLIASGLAVLNMGAVFSPIVGAIPLELVETSSEHEKKLINNFKEFKHRVDNLLNYTILEINPDASVWMQNVSPYQDIFRTVNKFENVNSCKELLEGIRSTYRIGALLQTCATLNYGDYAYTPDGESMPFLQTLVNNMLSHDVTAVINGDLIVKAAKQIVVLNAVICLNNLVRRLYAKCCKEVHLNPNCPLTPAIIQRLNSKNNIYADLITELYKIWSFGDKSKSWYSFVDGVMYWDFMDYDARDPYKKGDYFKKMKNICTKTKAYLIYRFRADKSLYTLSTSHHDEIHNHVLKLFDMCAKIPNLIDEVGL